MKTILPIIVLLITSTLAFAQQTPREMLAEKIAVRMKDSLQLSTEQKEQLYQVNIQLSAAKLSKRQQYTNTDSLRRHIQRIENTRDSLYRPVLSQQQYELYLSKKRNFINNN
jgi:hypothetical protein